MTRCQDGSEQQVTVALVRPSTGGRVILCGFDIGLTLPLSPETTPTDDKAVWEMESIAADCFNRDRFVVKLIETLN